jgi:hypothetical protein
LFADKIPAKIAQVHPAYLVRNGPFDIMQLGWFFFISQV